MHYDFFDILRLVACLLVTYSHHFALHGKAQPVFANTSLGGIGVLMFFAISGYLLSLSQQRSTFKRFAQRRILRIYPALAVCTVLTFIAVLGFKIYDGSLVEDTYGTFKYIRNMFTPVSSLVYAVGGIFPNNPDKAINGSLWTIPHEIYAYIYLAVGYFIPEKFRRYWLSLMFVIFAGIGLAISLKVDWMWLYSSEKPSIVVPQAAFFFGALVATFPPAKAEVFIKKLSLWSFAAYLFLTGVAGSHLLLLLSFVIWVLLSGLSSSNFAKGYRSKLGDISYGFYLYSFPIQQLTVLFGIEFWTGLVLSILVTSLLAYASFHLVEERFLKLKLK